MDSKEKLQALVDKVKEQTGLTQEQMAMNMGYSKTYISESLTPTGKVTDKFLKAFESHYKESLENPNTGRLSYTEQRRNQKTGKKQFMVPLVPVKAQAGYVRSMDQERFIDTMEEYALPPGVNPQGAVWRYWEVEGESMEPSFHNGDIILTSQVHQMDWEQLRNFYLYVIVTHERVLFKRLFCKNPLEWVLISENEEEHPQQLLPADSVKEVWVYRRSIVNKAPPIKMFEIKV